MMMDALLPTTVTTTIIINYTLVLYVTIGLGLYLLGLLVSLLLITTTNSYLIIILHFKADTKGLLDLLIY